VGFQTFWILILGFGLGLKHAVEADHLAAVSTIVTERRSVWSASFVGGIWGIGHTLSLLLAALAIISLRIRISERVAQSLELCVAVMLVLLGANVVRKVLSGSVVHMHAHRHGSHQHVHLHMHSDRDSIGSNAAHHDLRFIARPLVVGMVHGLAGSAALMLIVLSTISSTVLSLLYIVLFGIGSVGGMMLMSACMSLPFRLMSSRFAHLQLAMHCFAGLISLGLGLLMAYEIVWINWLVK
jgi:high-affinity nickel permease